MNLKDKLKTLPDKPGCYLMKDKDGIIIYVGKAINLKNRVNSYFRGVHDYKTTKLVSNIVDFDFIVVTNEKEALILEYNLIKKYDPKYNIQFKDDSSYPYILVSDSDIPYLSVVRINKKNKLKGKLYGPYPEVTSARNTVDLINRLLPTRKCKNLQKQLCLYYHLGQCLGYCTKQIDKKDCLELKNKIINILNGNVDEYLNDLKSKMDKEVELLNFEKAKEYRDLINDLKYSFLRQNVQKNNKTESFDVFNYEAEDGYISITGLFINKGRLLNSHKHLEYLIGDKEDYVSSYIYQFYENNQKPKTLYVPNDILPYLQGLDYEVKTVSKGQKYQLLKDAKINSIEHLRQNKESIQRKNQYYEGLYLDFKNIFNKNIYRIELFDNSHLSGTNTVASMVVYKNFKPSKKDYRLFKLEESNDDIRNMHEVLYRRYFRAIKESSELPDLLIVDGSFNQINAAKDILNEFNLDIILVGLGKDEHHNTSYLMDSNLNKININKDSNIFFFLANCQDEVHRFAIEYHKKLRRKAQYESILDKVEGIGPQTKKKLLNKYKTISNIKTLSLDELKTVLNENIAIRLYNKIKENDNEELE